MSEPFLWGPRISLQSGVRTPHVMALKNGTFLVLGRIGTLWEESAFRAWIYNADGTLKEEKTLDAPKDHPWADITHLDRHVLKPIAVELPDGRIAITFSIFYGGNLTGVAWLGLYGADLQPLGATRPIAGLTLTGPDSTDYVSDDIVSFGDGSLAVAYRSHDGQAFLRIMAKDGVLSNPISLGPTLGVDPANVANSGSVIDLTALPNGKAVVLLRVDATKIQGYLLDPSGGAGSVLSNPFTIPVLADTNLKSLEVTTLEEGGFVVTWVENGKGGGPVSDPEPSTIVKFQVYDAEGTAITGPLAFYGSVQEAGAVGTPDILALPGGGFALAAQVVPHDFPLNSEVRLAIFDASGSRVSDKLLVSKPAAEGVFSVKGLSLLADGRIAVHLSSGIQIVDPRDKAISLKGTAGNDQYIGTAFNDTFEGSVGADILNGGDGIDYVSFANAKAGVTASLAGGSGGDAAGDTYISIEGLLGSSFDDFFIGSGLASLKGGLGNDVYDIRAGGVFEEAANGGRDTVIVGGSYALKADAQVEVLTLSGVSSKTSAHLTGSTIANEIVGHAGKNTLKGLGGNDAIRALSGDDRIYGDAGNDTLYGGSGNDKLYGGSGRDAFLFDTKPNKSGNVDRIVDFNPRYDSVRLENKVFTKLGKGSDKGVKFKSDMFVNGAKAQDREDRIVYDKKSGAIYYDQDGTGSKAQVKIATLSNKTKLTYHDFFVV